jgi:hypothetical protein
MWLEILIIFMLAGILASLGAGLFYLVKDKKDSKRMVTALTVRVSLSVFLFVLLIVGYLTGLIQPHGALPQ